uniref:Nuclear transcription factor Y subunit n=1 Tax=Noccaea caerulescens TaxID=107243 RepID=A0A1J3GP03_NOCCA
MQTDNCKEREGLLSPPQTSSWWNAFGSPPLTTVSLAGDSSESFAGVKVVTPETEEGGGKSSRDVPKPNVAFALVSSCFEFGFAQPTIYTKHPHAEQYYGVVSAYGSQMSSSRVMLPLKMETEEDGTIYVNSKQYHGIIRRRQSRAKAVLKNKLSNCRKQPYMHHSRHLHAMRRPRGSGGRFLNTNKADPGKQSKASSSQNSQVFHPEDETMTHPSRERYVPKVSGSQVTSMDYFLSSSVHSLGGMVTPSKWIASAMDIGCCDLKT